jgi:mannosyltransferase
MFSRVEPARSPARAAARIALLLVILVGFGLRLAVSASRDFWYDEAFSALVASQAWTDLPGVLRNDVHPPLYYVLLRSWVTLSGNSVETIRFFSVFFGTLTIPLAWAFLANASVSRPWLPVVAAWVFSVNPFFVDYSVEARTYSLLTFVMLCAGYGLLKGLTASPHRFNRAWLLFSVCVSLGFLAHYMAAFAIGMFYTFAVLFVCRREGRLSGGRPVLYVPLCLASLLPAAVFLAWLPVLVFRLSGHMTGLGWVPMPDLSNLPMSVYAFLFGVDSQASGPPPVRQFASGIPPLPVAYLLCAVVLVAGAGRLVRRKRPARPHLAFCALLSLVPPVLVLLLGRMGARLYVDRFLIVHGVFFVLLVVLVCGTLRRAALVLIVALYSSLAAGVYANYEANDKFSGLSGYLDRHAEIERVVFSSAEDFVSGSYYLKDRSLQMAFLDRGFRDPQHAYANWYVNWAWISEADILTNLDGLDGSDLLCGYENESYGDLVERARLTDGFVLFVTR